MPQLYGTTHTLLGHVLPRQGITARFAESDKADAIERLIDENTKAVFSETIGNPAGNVCDIEALAKVAHRHGVPLVVDNTVATPILLKPFDYGADIAVHSLTKFLGGHGTTLGGAIVDSGRFPWTENARRFPAFNEPDESYHGLVYTKQFGSSAYIQRARSVYQRTMGSVLSPFNAFLLLQGIETVALRVERHVENARKVAEFLRNDPRVDWVNYAGFPDSPYYALVQKYLNGNASSLFTFGIKGGMEAGKTFYDALKLITRLVNIGDAKSLACHPASTTHRQMSAEQQRMAGVLPETIRLSIGIEHVSDIIEDIDQALAQACRRASAARGRGIDRRARHDRPVGKTATDRQSRPRAGAVAAGGSIRPSATCRCGPHDRARQQHAGCGAAGDRTPVHAPAETGRRRHPHRFPLLLAAFGERGRRPRDGGLTGNTPISPISTGCRSMD